MKVVLVFLLTFFYSFAQEFTFYTEELPPYNYIKNKKVMGISTLLLEEMMNENGTPIKQKQIKLGTWQSGYETVLKTKNTAIYSAARLLDREDKFKWVGPIDELVVGLIAKKAKNIKIHDVLELNNYTIGALHRTAAEQLLKKKGVDVEKMDRFSNIKSQLQKLEHDRVDMVAFATDGMKFVQLGLGINPNDYEIVYVLKKVDLYYAFNKDTDDAFIEKLNKIVKKIRKKGFVKKTKTNCGL